MNKKTPKLCKWANKQKINNTQIVDHEHHYMTKCCIRNIISIIENIQTTNEIKIKHRK